jgi:micrococcal nuclease
VRRLLLLTLVGVAGFGAALVLIRDAPASQARGTWFRSDALVTRVVDGDTLDATTGGKKVRVRLIGIDTPERGACFFGDATAAAKRLAIGRRVVLVGDRSQDRTDRYGRLLAYVQLPGGQDLARSLIAGGFGRVYVYSRAFARVAAYRSAETSARNSPLGLWSSCGSTATAPVATVPTPAATTTAASRCDPSYPDFCIPPPPPDLDCKDIPRKAFRVLQPDPHRLDGNKDGVGCE